MFPISKLETFVYSSEGRATYTHYTTVVNGGIFSVIQYNITIIKCTVIARYILYIFQFCSYVESSVVPSMRVAL